MTIRRRLTLAFLLVALMPAALLTWLAFSRAQSAMRDEIERTLAARAHDVALDVDQMLFERLQNATTWSHLEVMQDLHVNDVDKRLSEFLAEMRQRYGGTYVNLYALNTDGTIIASSDAASIGNREPVIGRRVATQIHGSPATIELPPHDNGNTREVRLRAPLVSNFTGDPLGELLLVVDWSPIEQMLDSVAEGRREVLLLDAEGRPVAASRGLRDRSGTLPSRYPDWIGHNGIDMLADTPLVEGQAIAAFARSPGYDHFEGFGWTTAIVQPLDEAMAPIHRMAWSFIGLLAATTVITLLLALGVAGSISRPIAALTDYTRRVGREGAPPEQPPPFVSGEIGDLTRSFVDTVNALERSQQTLVRASKLAVAGELAATMAHEIRTPLGILRSSAQMLQMETALSAEGREMTGFVLAETERLNRLVGTLLESARARPPRPRPEDLAALVQNCIGMLRQQARRQQVSLLLETSPGTDPVIACDAEQITQVLLNLMINALQLMPDGGSIVVELSSAGEQLQLAVADTGPGVPEADRAHIFEPFFYRREGGIGLGLSVVAQIVAAHGGDIRVTAGAEGGARFEIRLPRHSTAGTTGDGP